MTGYDVTVYDIAAALPSIDVLRERCKALAVLECVFDDVEPYYSYTCDWGEDEAALMTNGSGDDWAAVFTVDGAFIRAFDHESSMSPYVDDELWPGLLDGVPAVFIPQIEEPAFGDELGLFRTTAAVWRLFGDDRWHAGEGIAFPKSRGPYDTCPDGSRMLEILLDGTVERYIAFAEDYHETVVDRAAVEHVVAGRPLTDHVIRALKPEAPMSRLRESLATIGYPIAAE